VEWRGVGGAIRHIAENLGLYTTGNHMDLIEALNLKAGDWNSNCHNQARPEP
jgi:hypothetical protein